MIFIMLAQNACLRTAIGHNYEKTRQSDISHHLLREGLRAIGLPECAKELSPQKIGRTEDGKPFFTEIPEVRFNLSHSGDRTACVFSDDEAGLDLQICDRPITSILRIAKRFFTEEEYEALSAIPEEKSVPPDDHSQCSLVFFYRLWSFKEAYLKYIGCGLRGRMDGFIPDPLPQFIPASTSSTEAKNILLRGRVRILGNDPMMTPADYALLRAPEGYTMVVCAKTLPEEIVIQTIE